MGDKITVEYFSVRTYNLGVIFGYVRLADSKVDLIVSLST